MRRAHHTGLVMSALGALLTACAAPSPPASTATPTPVSVTESPTGAPPATASLTAPLLIKGALTYLARIALPPQALMLVELRDAGSGALLGLERRRLDGAQVPLPFGLTVERVRLAGGGPLLFRGGIVIDERAAWLTPTITLTGDATQVNLGLLELEPVASAVAPAD